MSVNDIGAYGNKSFRIGEKGYDVYDLAKTIQQDRRSHACAHRMVSGQARRRSLTVGRYRVTVQRRGRGEVIFD